MEGCPWEEVGEERAAPPRVRPPPMFFCTASSNFFLTFLLASLGRLGRWAVGGREGRGRRTKSSPTECNLPRCYFCTEVDGGRPPF